LSTETFVVYKNYNFKVPYVLWIFKRNKFFTPMFF
jgi:hypothetical protein